MSKPGRPRVLNDVKQREIIALIFAGCMPAAPPATSAVPTARSSAKPIEIPPFAKSCKKPRSRPTSIRSAPSNKPPRPIGGPPPGGSTALSPSSPTATRTTSVATASARCCKTCSTSSTKNRSPRPRANASAGTSSPQSTAPPAKHKTRAKAAASSERQSSTTPTKNAHVIR